MLTVADIISFLQDFAPLRLAAEWDNVGLLLGDEKDHVERIMTCLTVTPESAAEAVQAGVQLIVSHHPILFRGCKNITADNPEGHMLLGLIRGGVAVYSPHTAFDNTPGGINDLLARRLDLREIRHLRGEWGRKQCKVVVFVPETDLNKVADAMFAAGAGNIGQYSQCSFRLLGSGTFFGSEATNPTIGQKGRREEVSEWRLEAICPEDAVERVVGAMRRAHSYEEPAYDVYSLRPEREKTGIGRLGKLPEPLSLEELGKKVKQKLSAAQVQIVGELQRQVQNIAIVCGAGGEFVADAVRQKADVLLTGEARFHDCLAAQGCGLGLLLPGHFATERPGIEVLADLLARQFPQIQVWASRQERDPLQLSV